MAKLLRPSKPMNSCLLGYWKELYFLPGTPIVFGNFMSVCVCVVFFMFCCQNKKKRVKQEIKPIKQFANYYKQKLLFDYKMKIKLYPR